MTDKNGAKPEIILDLDELTEPAGEMRLGGTTYHLVRWDSLGLLEQKRIDKDWAKALKLDAKQELSKKEADEHAELLRAIIGAISDVPAEVIGATESATLSRAALGYFVWRALNRARSQKRMETMLGLSTGETLSAASMTDGQEQIP